MLAVIDYRSSKESLTNLNLYVEDIYLFRTEGITYNSISGHPDIFIYHDNNNLIAAPNSPSSLFILLDKYKVKYRIGKKHVGDKFEESVAYNCLGTPKYFFHKKGHTEETVLEVTVDKKFINLPQAYTRCGLIYLGHDAFITSDKGIEKELIKNNFKCFYFDPSEINIPGHRNGFIGGCSGITNNKIFFNGNIDLHKDGAGLKNYILNFGMEIICLGNHKLYDGGCIIFI